VCLVARRVGDSLIGGTAPLPTVEIDRGKPRGRPKAGASVPSATLSTRGRRRSQPRLTRKLKITIESFNREMRKVLKTRTQFPNDDAVAKTLWLAIVDAVDERAAKRARQAGKPADQRESVSRLI